MSIPVRRRTTEQEGRPAEYPYWNVETSELVNGMEGRGRKGLSLKLPLIVLLKVISSVTVHELAN